MADGTDAEQVLITIAAASGAAIRAITAACEEVGLPAQIVPALHEIVGGQVELSRIRRVRIEDLLRRDPVQLDRELIAGVVRGQTVLVTGAAGSIGSELCRQIVRFGPRALVLVERAESPLFGIHRELLRRLEGAAEPPRVVPCLADVTDPERMAGIFAEHAPSLVLHAAAYKHVPLLEVHPREAVRNNVLGTRTVADLAKAHGVGTFVLVSTDKAVNPSSIMGATKRIAERYVGSLAAQGGATRFVAVRFGNVLGSAGSVVPIFEDQIARGGPVTVTHPDMERYFMTIPEACQLILQAGAMGQGARCSSSTWASRSRSWTWRTT